MALGLPPGGGDIVPMIKYDARAGRFSRDNADITQGFSAVFDLAQVDIGWIRFASMQAPDFVLVRAGQTPPDRPSKDHKRGVRLMCVLARSIGGDVREFSSAAGCVIDAIDDLHSTYAASPEAAAGKLPIVALTGSSPVKTQTPTGQTTNYRPNFTITGWTDRPESLPLVDGPVAKPAMQSSAQPSAQSAQHGQQQDAPPANHVPPPSPKQPAGAGAAAGSEF
jgi:hypothetical protein